MRPMAIAKRIPDVSMNRIFLFLVLAQGIRLRRRVMAPGVVVSMAPPGVGGTTCR
jgi:hypothetical protein